MNITGIDLFDHNVGMHVPKIDSDVYAYYLYGFI